MSRGFDETTDAGLYQNYAQPDPYLLPQSSQYETPALHHHTRLSFGASFPGPNATHAQSSPGSHDLSPPSLTTAHARASHPAHASPFPNTIQLDPISRMYQDRPWSMAHQADAADSTNNAGPRFTTPSHPVVRPPAAPLPQYQGHRSAGLGARSNPESSHVTDSHGGAAVDSGYGTGNHHYTARTRSQASGVDYGGGEVMDDGHNFVPDLTAMDLQQQGLGSAAHGVSAFYSLGAPQHQPGLAAPPHPGQAMEEPPPEPGVELTTGGLSCEQDECARQLFKNASELRFVCHPHPNQSSSPS